MKNSLEYTKDVFDFIDDAKIERLLCSRPPDRQQIRDIIAKSMSKQALTLEETAHLARIDDPDLMEEIFASAQELKERVYGNRIVLFAPFYIGNHCVNNCRYCAFKASNKDVIRRTLNPDEIREQVIALEKAGHKRLILVFGEHPDYDPEFIAESVRTVYRTHYGNGEIRRVNINAAPFNPEGFRIIKEAGIGTYQIFQETYHHATYSKWHPEGTRKANYLYRLDALDRAMEAGCDDVGIGALFGLYNWRFDLLGLVAHAIHLMDKYGVGPHTISFPRLRPAAGINMDWKYKVSDLHFKLLVAILRLAVPYTGLILTARENPDLRREVMRLGVSQIDAGSRIELGAYTEAGDAQVMEREQFTLGDIRSLDEVMRELLTDGYIPSFCTACYRLGRTGEHFMEFAIPGFIKQYCTPNAILTLKEYLMDYASEATRRAGAKRIHEELKRFDDEPIKLEIQNRIHRIEENNERDLYF